MTTRWIVCGFTLIAVLSLSVAPSYARPKYKKSFDSLYSKFTKTTCAICHGDGDDKKKRNHYGEALAKELGAKNVMDDDKIKKALKAIENGDCKTGKWKPRLDEGKAPCEDKLDNCEIESYISRQLRRSASSQGNTQ